MKSDKNSPKLKLEYPCQWSYKVIGSNIVVLTLLSFILFSFPALGNNSSAEMHRAITLSFNGKDKEAQKIIEAILKKEPKNLYAHNNLGLVLMEQGKFDKAITSFENSLKIDPVFPLSLNNIGLAYKHKKNYKNAEFYFKKALKSFPDLEIAVANLGELYFFQKRYEEAIFYLKKIIQLDRAQVQHHQMLKKAIEAKSKIQN